MIVERFRNWFLTIWPGADCYSHIQDILCDLKCKYYFIYHTPDEDDKCDHIHLVLCYDNARTFDAVKKKFPGANIRKCIYLCASIQYLCHFNDINKKQYPISDIVTNDLNDLNEYFNGVDYVAFSIDDLVARINSGCIHNLIDCSHYYRLCDINKYRNLIKDIFNEVGTMIQANDSLERRMKSMELNYENQIEDLLHTIDCLNSELNNRGLL